MNSNSVSTPPDLSAAFAEIVRTSRADGRGRIFAVSSGLDGAGTSYVARNLALAAAASGFSVCLADMDLSNSAQYAAFSDPQMQAQYGALEGPYDAAFGADPFWNISPSIVNEHGVRETNGAYMGLHLVGQTGLCVTQFLWDKLKPGQSVHIGEARGYWNALRDRYAMSFIDVPATGRSEVGMTVFGEVDGTIMITDSAQNTANNQMLSSISQSRGQCIGAILNTVHMPPQYGDSA